MNLCVIGAGALGGSFAARLSKAGAEVTLVDAWAEHVAAINKDGLEAAGVPRPLHVRLPAFLPEDARGSFDAALIATDANSTGEAAQTVHRLLRPDGIALTLQNGIGNIETLCAALGAERVIGGSTTCSFRREGPGRVEQTHLDVTSMGELDGRITPRVEALGALFKKAGYETVVSEDIMTVVWGKFVTNVAVNALCAVTGLRLGEAARLEATATLQERILDEAFAVVRAKSIPVPEAKLRAGIKERTWRKFSEPSMLQHVNAGRRTEIDALNGALVREAAALGIATPFNEALTMLLKGRELAQQRRLHEGEPDWAALEKAAADEPRT
ncbi:2-dehydropantoate 2-reductase [Geminicoccaceae bacterium 1502E]|nr:2-dehydropantoate 2-reductase [Geminicoccaceae bacterium 1502E]